jgi:parallel beta-helix repeat protein
VQNIDVLLRRSDDNLIAENTFLFSAEYKVGLDDSNRNLVRDNTLSSTFASDQGISLAGSDNRIERNDVSGNVIGILVGQGARNMLIRNQADGTGEDGILVGADAGASVLRANVASANRDDGIEVRDPSARLIRNVATNNGDLGIEAVPGVSGLGNAAFGNGNPLQCVNIFCKTNRPRR